MIPNARYAAAIECLDRIFDGVPAEKTLSNWARSNRYAGSKDRAAVRDIVFDCLRCKRSFQHNSGISGARGVIAGHILASGVQVSDVFTGERFAPIVMTKEEQDALASSKDMAADAVRLDCPDWCEPLLRAALGDDLEATMAALQNRGPLDLRVNTQKTNLDDAELALLQNEISVERVEGIETALRVVTHPRRVAQSDAYKTGLVEIQDAGSQAVVNALPLDGVKTVLDYCAGGGGKSLAMAANTGAAVTYDAYDRIAQRMKDLPERAARADAQIHVLKFDPVTSGKQYDLVLLDVPCSGTGAWRRNPDGKWRLLPEDLDALVAKQKQILDQACGLVSKDGCLAYVTCSLLLEENETQIEHFLQNHSDWAVIHTKRLYPSGGTDGFFLSIFKRNTTIG